MNGIRYIVSLSNSLSDVKKSWFDEMGSNCRLEKASLNAFISTPLREK